VKYWEMIADNLSKAGWSLGWISALDLERRTIWIVDAHRGDEKRFVVGADEKLTAVFGTEIGNSQRPAGWPQRFRQAVEFCSFYTRI
jgi:hypothetical protein